MDASAIGILGAVTTVAAVIVTHVLNQRAGEKRATQVRDELSGRIDTMNTRVTEVREALSQRISEVKTDLTARIAEVRGEAASQGAQIRSEIANSANTVKEVVSAEVKVMKAEILARLPERARSAAEHKA
ncbi:MAG TPA: hypothetical protein VHU83_08070 [Bryobacteraceae bacterium]|jgi:DNA anti-recombination protein RmuC|nr:hypothetical protein [Bryobacteraceae bacterium]